MEEKEIKKIVKATLRQIKVEKNTEIVQIILGTIGIYFLVTGSIWLSGFTSNFFVELWECSIHIKYFLRGVLCIISILVVGAIIRFVYRKSLTSLLIRGAQKIGEATEQIDNVILNDGGLIPESKVILKDQKSTKNIDKIALLGNYQEIQEKFIEKADLKNENHQQLRILGTMLGTFGEGGITLGEQLASLANNNNKNQLPYETIHFCSTGHPKDSMKEIKAVNALYPFAARITAGMILLEYVKSINNFSSFNFPMRIYLNFVEKDDIFPAIQSWGKKAAMVLCSTGATDRKNPTCHPPIISSVIEAMPIALFLREKYKLHNCESDCDLTNTLTRIENYLINDYKMDTPKIPDKSKDYIEEWVCAKMDNYDNDGFKYVFYVKNYQLLKEEITLKKRIETKYKNRDYEKYEDLIRIFETIKKSDQSITTDENYISKEDFENYISKLKTETLAFSKTI